MADFEINLTIRVFDLTGEESEFLREDPTAIARQAMNDGGLNSTVDATYSEL